MNETSPTSRIAIETPLGLMFAELSGDSNYPGIYICIEQENKTYGKYERQLALVECTPDMPGNDTHSLRLLTWRKNDTGDYTDSVMFDGVEMLNSDSDSD